MFVNIKLVGEKAVVNLFCSLGNPNPTLSELGVISSSVSDALPDPNWIWRVKLSKNLVANLLFGKSQLYD